MTASPTRTAVTPECIAAARAGDRESLAVIFRAHNPPLLRFLRGLAETHAEDVAGQVWVEVAGGLARFEGDDDDLRRWLFTIARRRMIDRFRSRTRRPEVPVAEPPVNGSHEGADASIERLQWAEHILRQLPPAQAEVVLLRVVTGFSVAEVAEMTDRTPGAVRVLAHRGLQRVLELLAEQDLLPNQLVPYEQQVDQEISTERVTQGSVSAMDPTR